METERLLLRTWEPSDADRLFELAKDPHVGPPCGWSPHQNIEESRTVLQNILTNGYTWAIVRKSDGLIIGDISLMPFHVSRVAENESEDEVGYWLGYPYWNQGYISEACARIIRYGFEVKHLKAVKAVHFDFNPASGKVMEKCGMQIIETRPAAPNQFFQEGLDVIHRITFEEWQKNQNALD